MAPWVLALENKMQANGHLHVAAALTLRKEPLIPI